jgi:hypothetical protein
MACFAPYDVVGDRRYAAFNCSWFSHRDFLRFHAAVPAKDVILDRDGVDLPLQQGRSRDCGQPARRPHMGDAGNLCCRIPVRLLDAKSAGGAADTFSPVSTTRLRALACVFTRYLAYLLARLYWVAFPGHSLRDYCLFCHAFADQPRQNAIENVGGTRPPDALGSSDAGHLVFAPSANHLSSSSEKSIHLFAQLDPRSDTIENLGGTRSPSALGSNDAGRLVFAPSAIDLPSSSEKPIHLCSKMHANRVCESECAD